MQLNKFVRLTWTSAILVTSFVASSFAAATTTPSAKDLPNFGVVDPGIFRGAAPTPAGIRDLKALGVQTVIDLRISPKHVAKEKAEVTGLGMSFINLPMGADPPTPKEETVFLSTLHSARQHPVYVHCEYGADRTGTMIGLYRRSQEHWSFAKTYTEMRRFGFKPYLLKDKAFVKNAASNS